MSERRRVRWWSAGTASAIATKLDLIAHPGGVIAYCETGSEHADNERFLLDCERWYGQEIVRLRSNEYKDVFAVWEGERYIAGNNGAPCTGIMKVAPRVAFQCPSDIHVFGYTSDRSDRDRAANFRANYFELTVITPLIERGLDKAACLAMLISAGIEPPVMYGLGFQNNNCIPCGKATSPNYWAAMRLHFPQQFWRTATIARQLGARLARIAGERIFIDQIPWDWPTLNPIAPACDFLCHLAEQDMAAQ